MDISNNSFSFPIVLVGCGTAAYIDKDDSINFSNYNVANRKGTVSISIIDARTSKRVWQTWTIDDINSLHMNSNEV